jgi:hypothetical protein
VGDLHGEKNVETGAHEFGDDSMCFRVDTARFEVDCVRVQPNIQKQPERIAALKTRSYTR